jgi:hypothetical protein
MMMVGCLGQSRPTEEADMVARTVAAVALAALAVIHVVDLPGTLGPIPLVGIGYLGIIAVAMLAGAAMIVRSHWLAWAAASGLAVAAMGGYVLTRSLSGGFLGDHGDIGNWRCPLGIAALSVETLIILLAAGWGAGQARTRVARAPRRPGVLRVLFGAESRVDQDQPLRPVRLGPLLDPARQRGIRKQRRMTSQKSYQR